MNKHLKVVENDKFDWYVNKPILSSKIDDTSYDWYQSPQIYNMANPSLCIVGLGPHSKRIYMGYMAELGKAPRLIIDLESEKENVLRFLKENNLNSNTFFVPDADRDKQNLSITTQNKLKKTMEIMEITHAIISTEPKAHKAYLSFFIENGIHTLTDKPITAPKFVNNTKAYKKLWTDYQELAEMYTKQRSDNNVLVEVQCQRRYHPVYQFIKNMLNEIVEEYQIPITYINSYHCDGMWNMPDEFLSRENHPYKYGYGKLFHSGNHFVDIVCWLLKANKKLNGKQANNFELYTSDMRPNDFMHVINADNYQKLFNSNKLNNIFSQQKSQPIDATGEIDIHTLIRFSENDKLITTVDLGLMQNGFSRRAWQDLPENTYKGNGRIRHERMNIQVGPLMNIQLHSYQSKEVSERRKNDTDDVGELEHLDVYIFRNVDLIGGKVFEKFTAKELMNKNNDKKFIGFNESARKTCLINFLQTKRGESDLLDHALTVKIMEKCYESMYARSQGKSPVVCGEII